jgi:hypothetical protein
MVVKELRNDNVLVLTILDFYPNDDGPMILECLYLVGRSGSKIQIFDRYGKLLKEISPNSTG